MSITFDEILHADAALDGYLEWVSGLIVVNRTRAEWECFIDAGPFDFARGQLTRTLVHETFHFYQIASTGWAYRFVNALSSAIETSIARDAVIERLVRGELIGLSPDVMDLAHSVDNEVNGLSVRGIMESAAYIFEFRAEYEDQGAKAFLDQMALEKLPPEYSAAWKLVANRLGESAAFDLVLPLALVALCFADPPAAFTLALDATAADAVPQSAPSLDWIRAISSRVAQDVEILGSAAEVAERINLAGQPQHKIYYSALREINDRADKISPLVVLTDPQGFVQAAEELLRPVMLRNRACWSPARFGDASKHHELKEALQNQATLAAVSVLLQDQLALPRPRSRFPLPDEEPTHA